MELFLETFPARVINLDRSRDRWIRFCRGFNETVPEISFERVSGVDGLEYLSAPTLWTRTLERLQRIFRVEHTSTKSKEQQRWNPALLQKLQTEGIVGKTYLLDPVRTALCMSHQRALQLFLNEWKETRSDPASTWGMIFEDDARPGEALASCRDSRIEINVPEDSELLFLHDRTWKRGASQTDKSPECVEWRIVRGGIGLEAYAFNVFGARKMLQAFRPVVEECDIQLMTFMEGYADLEKQRRVHKKLNDEGVTDFPKITAYAPVSPLFQTDHWQPSVKFDTMVEAGV
ncbi:MAG: hypothetical protein MI807_13565 [Verrucomicrobiales bacterium]|nr:hypothetical protein [Verrucomicrobiales bacterium]